MPDPTDHPEYLGLMADVIAEPKDDTPRLIVADWLDDHGRHGHAAFVRFQVANPWAKWVCTPNRSSGTFNGVEYTPPQPTWLDGLVYRRGFVDEVQTTLREWLEHGPALVRLHPVVRVTATDKRSYKPSGTHSWVRGSLGPSGPVWAWLIPGHIWQLIDLPEDHLSPGSKAAQTEDEANDALSDALLAWARKEER